MPSKAQLLSKHQWENRILLVFAEQADNSLFVKQLTHFQEDKVGLVDRDLVIYQIYEYQGTAPNRKELYAEEVEELRIKYQVAKGDFVVILIGKDGGEKLRKTNELLTRELLYATIDVMPMRRAEMRRKKND
ncbi:MAG: DUF4174 domain-containing protein [Bacteroidota bacterium]